MLKSLLSKERLVNVKLPQKGKTGDFQYCILYIQFNGAQKVEHGQMWNIADPFNNVS
jgi:hypothetical protein